MALDAYEAAGARVKKIGEIATGAASGASSAASGTAASPIAGSPLADVVAKTKEGVVPFRGCDCKRRVGEDPDGQALQVPRRHYPDGGSHRRIMVPLRSRVCVRHAVLHAGVRAAVAAGFGLMVVNSREGYYGAEEGAGDGGSDRHHPRTGARARPCRLPRRVW